MHIYSYLLFDLDGTLTDSSEGIINSIVYALNKMQIPIRNPKILKKFIGPPLVESYMKYYGLTREKALEAVLNYREYFTDRGMFENKVYEGIPDLLTALKKAGKTIVLATSKPEIYAKQILEHFNLLDYFDDVVGAELDETRTKKVEVIEYVLEKNNIQDKTQVLMIGDRKHDIEGAQLAGVDALGVLYGFGSREELETAGAEKIAENVQALQIMLLS